MNLQPCPFCGQEESFINVNHRIMCPACLALGPVSTSARTAGQAWDSRPRVLESLPRRQAEAYRVVLAKGEADYEDVGTALGINRTHASKLLRQLADLGVLSRNDGQRPYKYKVRIIRIRKGA
jgi:hypothetical protein